MGRRARGPSRGLGHRPRQRSRPRHHRGGPPARVVHRQRNPRLPGVPRVGRRDHTGVGGARDRCVRRADPADGPALRDRRPRDHLLDPRDHGAPQRGGQRPRAHQPRAPHRPRRAPRIRVEPPARAEQRPGRRRHGGRAPPPAGLPGRPRRRQAAPVRGALGRPPLVDAWLERDRDARGRQRGHAARALRHRREPGGLRRRHAPRREGAGTARPPGGRGSVPHANGRARARRPPGRRRLVRDRGDGDGERPPRPAHPKGTGAAARRPRRSRGRPGRRAPARRRLVAPADGARDLGRAPGALADPPRDELRAARDRQRAPVALLGRESPRRAVPPRAPLEDAVRGRARSVQAGRPRSARRRRRCRVPTAPHDRPAARLVQHRCPVEPLHDAAPHRGGASVERRRHGRARPGRRRARPGALAARPRRGGGPHRRQRAGGARVHDVPLPRADRDEPPDDQRGGPALGHRGVQGLGGARREGRAARTP